MSNRDDEPGRVDWLDLGPDPDEGRPPANPRRRYLWYGVAAALVVLALVLTRTQHGTNRAATSPRSPAATGTPSRTVSSAGPGSAGPGSAGPGSAGAGSSVSFVDPPVTTVTISPGGQPTAPTTAPRVTYLGHPLLDVPADWELVGWGPGVVVRIQLKLGRITTTAVPVSGQNTLVVFVVGSDRAIVRSMDDTTGYVVRDGKQATQVPPSLRQGAWILPGPDQQHLWSDQAGEEQGQLALLTLDGKPAGARIDVPVGTGVLGSDGAGYVLLAGIGGGVYDARPGGAHRVTTGTMLASGPTRWLTVECDDNLSCANVAIDRASGARHTVSTQINSTSPNSGIISPDGRTAAMLRHDGISSSGIHLLDLDSGADRAVEVNPYSPGDEPERGPHWAWSPDSRWLFATDAAGRVMIINRDTGRATPVATRLPSLDQLVLRHGAG